MATLTIPYSFIDATPIVASEMNTNFTAVKTFSEGLADGSNIDTGAITSDKLATSAVQLLTPTGSIVQYAGATAPAGWVMCDGQALSQTTYAALYAVIGSTYNTAGGQAAPAAGTFRVPILTGRVPVGKAASGTFASLAATGGAETHTLTEAQLPSHQHGDGTLATNSQLGNHQHGVGTYDITAGGTHTHDYSFETTDNGNHTHGAGFTIVNAINAVDAASSAPYQGGEGNIITSTNGLHRHTGSGTTNTQGSSHDHGFTGSSADANLAHSHDVTGSTGPIGSGQAHNILQPYIVVNYIIKL